MAERQMIDPGASLDAVAAAAAGCAVCAAHLPLGPRPVFRVGATARVMIVGQAPGTAVHATGIPWNDASGRRLRDWLGLAPEVFYDTEKVAIVPMGFCYPGRYPRGGDLPPRPECAPLWHDALRVRMPAVALTLLVGQYAQKYYLGRRAKRTLTETVAAWRDFLPAFLPTPHPSWRTTAWQRRNPWFESELLPALRARLEALVG